MTSNINNTLRNVLFKKDFRVSCFWSMNSCTEVKSFNEIPAAQKFFNEIPAAPKPFNEIPAAPSVPLLGSLPYFLMAGGHPYMFRYIDKLHKKLGPIFSDKLGGNKLIFIAEAEANYEMWDHEGQYPRHAVLESWKEVLKEISKGRGLFFMDGEEWHKTRSVFNQIILKKNSMTNHVQKISTVSQDLMNIWKTNPPTKDLKYHLSCWNVECFGEIVFGKRLGFMEKLKSDKSNLEYKKEEQFVNATYQVFTESANLYSWPVKYAKIFKKKSWKRFHASMKTVLEYGETYVQNAIQDCRSENPSENVKQSVVYQALLAKLEEEKFAEVMIDLFLASPDTLTHAASWILYLLGRNPEIANQAREEIFSVLKKEEVLTLVTIDKIKHIAAIIQESLRLYSVAPFITRTMPNELELCGYTIPANTHVMCSLITMGRDPNNFTDPLSFRPERWWLNRGIVKAQENDLAVNSKYVNHKRRAYTPWAYKARSCVGRRIAELNLSLLIIESLKTFEWTVEEEVPMKMRLVTVPAKDIVLKLKPL